MSALVAFLPTAAHKSKQFQVTRFGGMVFHVKRQSRMGRGVHFASNIESSAKSCFVMARSLPKSKDTSIGAVTAAIAVLWVGPACPCSEELCTRTRS